MDGRFGWPVIHRSRESPQDRAEKGRAAAGKGERGWAPACGLWDSLLFCSLALTHELPACHASTSSLTDTVSFHSTTASALSLAGLVVGEYFILM